MRERRPGFRPCGDRFSGSGIQHRAQLGNHAFIEADIEVYPGSRLGPQDQRPVIRNRETGPLGHDGAQNVSLRHCAPGLGGMPGLGLGL